MKNLLLITIVSCFMLLPIKKSNAQQHVTIGIDFGVLYTWNGASSCASFPWICNLDINSTPSSNAIISYDAESLELSIKFSNSSLSKNEFNNIFGGKEMDFHSKNNESFYVLPDAICNALHIEIGYKILAKKYRLDKSDSESTVIIFK